MLQCICNSELRSWWVGWRASGRNRIYPPGYGCTVCRMLFHSQIGNIQTLRRLVARFCDACVVKLLVGKLSSLACMRQSASDQCVHYAVLWMLRIHCIPPFLPAHASIVYNHWQGRLARPQAHQDILARTFRRFVLLNGCQLQKQRTFLRAHASIVYNNWQTRLAHPQAH